MEPDKQMQREPTTLEGRVESVYIFGFEAETSHTCQISFKPDDSDAKTLLLAFNDASYRPMLGALLSATLGRCRGRVTLDSADCRYIGSVSVQKALAAHSQVTEAEPPPANMEVIPSSLVQSLDAGSGSSRSSFKLASGETVLFDSIDNPKRSGAMMQLVAAAFGAAARVVVEVVRDGNGKSIAQSVSVAP